MTGRRLQAGTRWLLAIAGIVLVVAALVVVGGVGRGEPGLNGTRLDGRAAPDFTLTDQRGQTVRLSDFRGKSVALTFIYTKRAKKIGHVAGMSMIHGLSRIR